MSKGNNKVLGGLQKLGKALMTPVACLPAAALLLRLGAPDVLNIVWMNKAGAAIFDNLAILFAIGIAIGLAKENNGVAGLAAAVGYFTITNVAITFDATINMGILAGVIVGVVAGLLYNRFRDIQLPQFLGFFGGKRFVPIVTAFVCLLLGFVAGYVWPVIQGGLDSFGNSIANAGAIGAFIFGVLNRLLIPIGLHHVLNAIFWFQFGSYTGADGVVAHGDIARFFAGDPTAGTYMTGFYFIMMFALPAACIAMILAAKKEKRKAVTGMLVSIALTAFLTGITEPIEFTFMFLAPVLYVFHAIMTGVALAVANIFGMKMGFGFSAGLLDYGLSFGISTKPVLVALVGLIFAAIYFVVFYFAIKKFNLPTPGRGDDDEEDILDEVVEDDSQLGKVHSKASPIEEKAALVLEALGGSSNIENIDACVTRIRLTVKDSSKIDEKALKRVGATGIMKLDDKNIQVVIGTLADPIVTHIKKIM
ncbi:MAG: N-acetylglucosamine-specific PTS transporter subunit IIBC [Clostridium baratii]|uniref:N-acetylglucosamine-specific PTS transporter subunit IIBC n=1 Tax=Clostridium baratii TaxID=1561 RepID=UPI0006BF5E47|nr:N-acetylglucosamine-specific PTS transporter subunit IIBC [Clostridium baratii]MBS6008005.1 N-acetylglucosamine-specific PTS transporter subunit IIBC [Clostridium baratii]MDU1054967.1 N-acetylglucosamine-specific PTS transporter subunit IIBC [Clostridium baratii]MDU4912301.1 N-acetylglucosamine-specific PTS transporter subunit IIBC [Clostridium baratii]CUP76207.1 PTS system transporter subunit IIC [Clostridium baratii]